MASGDSLGSWLPQDFTLPPTNMPSLDVVNNVQVAGFDPVTEWTGYLADILPANYAGGGLTFAIKWRSDAAITGDVKWGVSIEAEGTDLDVDSFASEKTAVSTCAGTSGVEVTTSIAFAAGAEMDNLAVGNRYRVRVARKAADAQDTMTGLAQITAIGVKET
jgi:hypothetical protein